MLSKLVIAYPKLGGDNYARIQSIRKEFDSRYYNIFEPHFTIVFPVFKCDAASLHEHVEKTIAGVKSIEFTLRCATIVKDSFSEYTDVFLVPDEGNSSIINLHDKLYTDLLKDELRLDIPFIPHIGIGASKSPNKAKQIADEINREGIHIKGIIDELVLTEYEYPEVKSVSYFLLK